MSNAKIQNSNMRNKYSIGIVLLFIVLTFISCNSIRDNKAVADFRNREAVDSWFTVSTIEVAQLKYKLFGTVANEFWLVDRDSIQDCRFGADPRDKKGKMAYFSFKDGPQARLCSPWKAKTGSTVIFHSRIRKPSQHNTLKSFFSK